MAFFLLAGMTVLVQSHMSLVVPGPARNAVDRKLPIFQQYPWYPYVPNCSNPNPHWDPQHPSGCIPAGTDGWGCNCANGTVGCNVGQSCLWFSDGCSIGCSKCDGLGGNPNTKDRCNSGMNATLCDPKLRTYNMDALCNTAEDIYRHNPWRAPGAAPVLDSCGMAGGGPVDQGGEAKYYTTPLAKTGDLGSKLPPAPTGTVWKIGATAPIKWSIRANHGGGYHYRLCPAEEELTEACFNKYPLQFATNFHTLEYSNSSNPVEVKTMVINGTYTVTGTLPVGSTWARNPLPYSNGQSPPTFPPPCDEKIDRTKSDTGTCSGRDPYNTLIGDDVVVPTVAPGKYVLGIRWDCEKSAQVWTNCADIEIEE